MYPSKELYKEEWRERNAYLVAREWVIFLKNHLHGNRKKGNVKKIGQVLVKGWANLDQKLATG